MATTILQFLEESIAPTSVELWILLFFLVGLKFVRLETILPGRKRGIDEKPADIWSSLRKAVYDKESASNVLQAWRRGCYSEPTPVGMVRPVVQALAEAEPQDLVPQLLEHLRAHRPSLDKAIVVISILEVVARSGDVQAGEALADAFHQGIRIPHTAGTYEVLLGAFASAGNESKVAAVVAEAAARSVRLTEKSMSLIVRGFLKHGRIDAAAIKFQEMHQLGIQVPTVAVSQYFRIATEMGQGADAFGKVAGVVPLDACSVMYLVEECNKSQNLAFAKRMEEAARQAQIPFTGKVYDCLLKIYTVAGDSRAVELFEEMQQTKARISSGLFAGLLSRCAEAKFLRFAEEIARVARDRKMMTISVYSALMNVYASCDMYGKACDLYDLICEDGLEPDAPMYGCLMKFAVECGRTDLSQRLSEVAPALDIHNYMSLIRAAGRDGDVDRAFAVLQRLKASHVGLDSALYNCVLSVCIGSGDMDRAHKLIEDMRDSGFCDLVTYNTLLKGYCKNNDLDSAWNVLAEISAQGLRPNDISFNCLVHASVNADPGNFRDAWATIDLMEKHGVPSDGYTISIMMKALKYAKNQKDIALTVALLDNSSIDVCSDVILFNTVLETFIRHQRRRLGGILAQFAKSTLRPTMQTYGSLIKASGVMQRLPDCWMYWRDMEQRGVTPTGNVMGCMLDALVCNDDIQGAVDLLAKWKAWIPPNAIMYSIIIRGFANSKQRDHALDSLRQMRKDGVVASASIYNVVIEAQAKVGAMHHVLEVVEMMEKDGLRLSASIHSNIARGYCAAGSMDKALEVFRNMQRNGMANDSGAYNTLLEGCASRGRHDLADALLEEMDRAQVIPSNITLALLVGMYGKRREVAKALHIIATLPKRFNFSPKASVWACLIDACVLNGDLDSAFEVWEDMKRHGAGGPETKAYKALLSACLRYKDFHRVIGLLEEAYGLRGRKQLNGQRPTDLALLRRTVQAIVQHGLAEKLAQPLLERLKASGIRLGGQQQPGGALRQCSWEAGLP